MSRKMKVSVCIPVYNAADYIEVCTQSLFKQTMTEGIEFIFVDDCSEDNSSELIQRTLDAYPHRKAQVRLVRNEQNQGQDYSRRRALQMATGEYVAFCDSDDFVDPALYASMYQTATRNDLDVVCCGVEVVQDGRKSYTIGELKSTGVHDYITKYFHSIGFNALLNKLFRTSILQGIEFDRIDHKACGEDLLMVSQILVRVNKIGFAPGAFYHYCYRDTGMAHYFSLEDSVELSKRLMLILGERYRKSVIWFVHAELMKLLRVKGATVPVNDYLWREAWSIKQIISDNRLGILKKILLLLSKVSWRLANTIIRTIDIARKAR